MGAVRRNNPFQLSSFMPFFPLFFPQYVCSAVCFVTKEYSMSLHAPNYPDREFWLTGFLAVLCLSV